MSLAKVKRLRDLGERIRHRCYPLPADAPTKQDLQEMLRQAVENTAKQEKPDTGE